MMIRNHGKQLLISLKNVAGTPGPQLGLKVGIPAMAWLRPVATRPDHQNELDIRCLTDWRNAYVKSFLTEFKATEDQTSKWLADIVGPDDSRILFMIDDVDDVPFGYMVIGFIDWETGYAEADSIVRGRPAAKGLMTKALKTLLAWGHEQLGLRTFGVRVRSDNPALEFYQKFGFIEKKRISLRCRREPDKLVWYEDQSNADPIISLVYLTLPEEKICD